MNSDGSLSREPRYRIGAVAKATGIAPDTLRMWERRYRGLTPARSDAGGRLYSDADIQHLRLIKQLIDRGHAIGRVAHLSDDDLRDILVRHDTGLGAGLGQLMTVDARAVREQFLSTIMRLDIAAAQQILARASLGLPPTVLVDEILVPILQEVGHRWAAGKLKVSHEHTASTLLRSLVGGLLSTYAPRFGGPTMVVTTPSGELHEFGALLTALLAAAAGWHVLYLGPNLPAEEMVETVARSNAAALAISVVTELSADASAEIDRLLAELPASVSLIVGGAAAHRYPQLGARATAFEDLRAFAAWLSARAPVPANSISR